LPIQMASRGKANIVPTGFELALGDHDFRVVNITPSVTLLTEVKSDPDGMHVPLCFLHVCLFVTLCPFAFLPLLCTFVSAPPL